MPQGNLWAHDELHEVRIVLTYNDLTGTIDARVSATSRSGTVLASSGTKCQGTQECELLPIWAAEVTYGFLYRGAKEACLLPSSALRARRKSLK